MKITKSPLKEEQKRMRQLAGIISENVNADVNNIDINALTEEMLSTFKNGTNTSPEVLCYAKELNDNRIEWCKGIFYKGELSDDEGLFLEVKGVELYIKTEWSGDVNIDTEGEYRPERFSKSDGVWEQSEEAEHSINLDDVYLSKATLVSDTSAVDMTSVFKSSGLDEELKERFFLNLDDDTINDIASYLSSY